ncbi:TolC family protein [Novipirellula artificiosorum]|uniref:Outer membrane efflux protein n=1 Tax=Novipirellula artificiosorum TaxID=2528016 RepID=A0A5C6DC26_9BACT|nr:TolC family protein [Novipirellula artificiosorum]TWU33404.1 Outer membrane efflux protein [Novipirellula artificiosorum]
MSHLRLSSVAALVWVFVSGALPVVQAQVLDEVPRDVTVSEFFVLLQSESELSETAERRDPSVPMQNGVTIQMVEADPLESPAESDEASRDSANGDRLTLADVVASLYRAYPEIARARQQPIVATGELTQAYGSFDTKLYGNTISEPLGNYENYRNGIGVARQTWWGSYLAAGYRIGRGHFQPWYKERQTDEAGEFKLAFVHPLLQGRAIDTNRLAVFQASLARQAADPIIQQAILDTSRDAMGIYWQWVAAGAVLEAQRELLQIAEKRGKQFEAGFEADKFAEIDLILNQQLIAERRAKVLETEQKYRQIAFKLSLYLRDEMGQPMVPSDNWLPDHFPETQLPESNFDQDLAAALMRRPEPQLLQLELRGVELERRVACNDLLPRVDFIAEASQDIGKAATKSDDKSEFELVIGLQGEMPIQRRKARGKIQSTTAKMVQINEKLRLQRDKIGAELMTAYNALVLAKQMVEQNEISLRAAFETLDRYRFAFDRGKIDLIYLNLLESKANETEIKLVEAQQFWFAALADMQAALGLDPLDQAMAVSALPDSTRPGPGDLPKPKNLEETQLQKDWELHSKAAE